MSELRNLDKKPLNETMDMLTLTGWDIDYKEHKEKFSLGVIITRFNALNLNNTDFELILPDFHKIIWTKLEILENGNHFISYAKQDPYVNDLMMYDPNQIFFLKTVNYKHKVIDMKHVKNKIVLTSSMNKDFFIEILDENLNVSFSKKVKGSTLVGADELCLYCADKKSIISYDWTLKRIDKKIKFQAIDDQLKFYVPFQTFLITAEGQKPFDYPLESGYDHNYYVIKYDLSGNMISLTSPEWSEKFRLNAAKDLIIMAHEYYHGHTDYSDLNGEPLQLVWLSNAKKDARVCYDQNDLINIY